MRIFKPKFFNFKFFTLFLLIFLLSSKTVFAGFQGKVTQHAVQAIEAALTKVGVIKNAAHADELEKGLRASTAAHRLRLSEIFLKLQKDPDFIKKFPEYAPLVQNPSQTVEKLLKHDAGKADQDGNLAMRALALLQGYDFRNRNKNLPEDVDKLVRTVLKDAIDDVNELEKKYVVHGTAFDNKVGSLAEVLDYYDTFKSRQSEIAKDGRKLKGPKEWLEMLYDKKDLTEAAKEELSLQKRLAGYLETKDPLKYKSAFTQASDVLKRVGSKPVGEIAKYFVSGSQKLVALPKVSTAKRYISAVSKGSKRAPVLGAALATVDYLIDPEDFSIAQNIQDTITSVTLTTSTSNCQTVTCYEFMSECAVKIGVKNKYATGAISSHKDFGRCIFDFFQLPLEVQSKKREDSDLNNILLEFSPSVRGLVCEKSGTDLKVTVDKMKKTRESESQVIQFNQSGNVSYTTLLPERQDQIQFDGKSASALRHCAQANKCEQFEMTRVKKESTYFWKDDENKVFRKVANTIPIQAFRWAKANSAFIEMQSENIKNCCDSVKCRQSLTIRGAQISASRTSAVAIQR